MRLVFATNNVHKLNEARDIMGNKIEIISLSDLGCHVDIPETGNTLDANSRQKAEFIFEHYGVDCFADDTGLEVDALDGRPGVYTARYAGEPVDFRANRHKLLTELRDINNRGAHFRTVATLILNGQVYQFEGCVLGRISTEEYGDGGFGYDPIFIPQGYDKTFAELPSQIKNSISHRYEALSKMRDFLSTLK